MISKNLPNTLTISRIICVPIFMGFMMLDGFPTIGQLKLNVLIAGIVFAIAMITDLFDGHLARKYNIVSNFGKLWDPIADKLMIIAALLGLTIYNRCNVFVVLIVVSRELIVSAMRATAASNGNIISANAWGKAKTSFQSAFVGMVLIIIFLGQMSWLPTEFPGFIQLSHWLNVLAIVVGTIMVLLTIWSGILYFVQSKPSGGKS